jgi:hypothetical protein
MPQKTFDTSGKSPAYLYHHAICKTAMALLKHVLMETILRFRA